MLRHAPLGLLLATLLGACGDDDGSSSDAATLDVVAVDTVFDAESYSVSTGTVEITLTQDGLLPHSLLIEDADGGDLGIRLFVTTAEVEDAGEIELSAGTYVLWCDVPGHRQLGMEATLTVEP
ncbi:MAG: hypothetical protein AAGA99_07985 [Actinomycetota bacterium]